MLIHQVLHGYSDGHRQLAASRELSRAMKHLMLTLSDMSGRSLVNGFEQYLTGYPLIDAQSYAFARTWYASEMERPGCVWTHTLLIELADLALISDLAALEYLFVRPSGSGIEAYCRPCVVSAPTAIRPHVVDPIAKTTLSVFYSTDSPVLIPASDSVLMHDLVIAIWNQQWPSLRALTSFCTGSMASRSVGGRPFDLQVIPVTLRREVRRDVANAVLIEPKMVGSAVKEEWFGLLTTDLALPDRVFRELLRQFADLLAPVLSGRAALPSVIEFILSTRNLEGGNVSIDRIIETLGDRFPLRTQARQLKKAVAGRNSPIARSVFAANDDVSILVALATANRQEAFDPVDLEIEARVSELWHHSRSDSECLVDQLLHRNHNVFGEAMLATILRAAGPEEIASLLQAKPSFLISAVRRDPEIALLPALWSGSRDRQREIFDAATSGVELTDSVRRRIVEAMLDAGSDAVAEPVFRRFDGAAVSIVLGYAETHKEGVIGREWLRGLSGYAQQVIDWLISSPGALLVASVIVPSAIDPHSPEVQKTGVGLWQRLLEQVSQNQSINLNAFVLALALDRSEPSVCVLLRATFESVHDAAGSDRLAYDAWSRLEDHLPYLSYYRNWDKCERLRRGVIDRFDRHEWPVVEFLHCAQKRETLMSLLRACYEYGPSGQRLLKRIKQDRHEALAAIPADWVDVIRYWI